jgi:two-component system, OmpR family, sensor histidine kinase QseC
MTWGLPRSLRGRLLLSVWGLSTGVWAAAAMLTWFDARHELDELLDAHLAQAAALLVVQQAHEADEDDRGIDTPSLHPYAPKVAFQVFQYGLLIQRSANAPSQPMVGLAAPLKPAFVTVAIEGIPWRVFATKGMRGAMEVYVGERLDSRESILRAILRSTMWPMTIALPLLVAATWWAISGAIAPLRSLGQALARRRPQVLEPVVVPSAPSEMTPMLQALNDLLKRIEALMASERRFTADAAHELRTPIAAIRAQAEAALGASDPGERQHALKATLQGCDRAARLVAQLLTLSRIESGDAMSMKVIDLVVVAKSVVADLAPLAFHKEQSIGVDAGAHCPVRGDQTLMSVLVRNLVDNAIRYSPRGASINISLVRGTTGTQLFVDDSGPGIAETDIKHLGERFFRSAGRSEEGSGLGWSILQRIAALHHATVQVKRSDSLGGTSVAVAFPSAH